MSKTFTTDELVTQIKADAIEWYTDGWDVIVETLNDEQVTVLVGNATTIIGARRRVMAWLRMDGKFLMSLPEDFYELGYPSLDSEDPISTGLRNAELS